MRTHTMTNAMRTLAATVTAVALAAALPVSAQAASAPPTPQLQRTVRLKDFYYGGSVIGSTKDDKHIVINDDGDIATVNLDSGERKTITNMGEDEDYRLVLDDNTLYVGNAQSGTITAYDVMSGKTSDMGTMDPDSMGYLQVSEDGTLLASGGYDSDSDDYTVQILDLRTKTTVTSRQLPEDSPFVLSKDLKTVTSMSTGDSVTVRAMDIASGEVKYSTVSDDISFYGNIGQLNDGTIVTQGTDGIYRINPDDGRIIPLTDDDNALLACNGDMTLCAVAEASNGVSALTDALSEEDLADIKLSVYDMSSGKLRWSTALPHEMAGMSGSSYNELSQDGRYLFMPSQEDSDGPVSLEVYNTKTGASSSVVLPGSNASTVTLADGDTKLLVGVSDDDYENVQLMVYSTGISMNLIDSLKRRGGPAMIVAIVAAVVVVLIVVAALILWLRKRKKLGVGGGAAEAAQTGGMPTGSGSGAVPVSVSPAAPAAPMTTAPVPAPMSSATGAVPTAASAAPVSGVAAAPVSASPASAPGATDSPAPAPAASAPVFCISCGRRVDNPAAKFCPQCGAPLAR